MEHARYPKSKISPLSKEILRFNKSKKCDISVLISSLNLVIHIRICIFFKLFYKQKMHEIHYLLSEFCNFFSYFYYTVRNKSEKFPVESEKLQSTILVKILFYV